MTPNHTEDDMTTIGEFRAALPQYEVDFESLAEAGYEFEYSERVEVVEDDRDGGHLLRGPGYSIRLSYDAEPIVRDETT